MLSILSLSFALLSTLLLVLVVIFGSAVPFGIDVLLLVFGPLMEGKSAFSDSLWRVLVIFANTDYHFQVKINVKT